jgi:multicomponent K+:H+ antiporter subunit G
LKEAPAMRVALEVAISFCLAAGGLFALIGAIGLVRLPDTLMRLHAPTKATTLGVGSVLLASMLYLAGSGRFIVHDLLVALFLFVTAPVSALMIARAVLKLGPPAQTGAPGGKENRTQGPAL